VVGDHATPSYSGLHFIEVGVGQVSKATALDALAADLGIAAEAVAAFGDNHNDVTMLRWAGRSYAMGNASDDAKAVADEVIATSDEDGLAVVVEQLVAEVRGS
jgi:hydroxymethylpyrimidine pyrophosphatase-like HAD family hydrolase